MAGLKRLEEHGNVSLVVCTNKPEVLAQRLVAQTDIAPFFTPSIRYVTGASPGVKQKPDPAHVQRALQTALGEDFQMNPARTIVVGDGHNDVEVAKALGCRSIAVTYGFGDEAALNKLNPTAMVSDFTQATALLESWITEDSSSL